LLYQFNTVLNQKPDQTKNKATPDEDKTVSERFKENKDIRAYLSNLNAKLKLKGYMNTNTHLSVIQD